MHQFSTVNWVAVLVAGLSGFIIGGAWYRIFQQPWMRLSGMTREKGAQTSMALTFGGAYVLNVVAAAGIALLAGRHAGWLLGLHTGAFAALFFVAPALGVIYLFEQRPLGLWFINAGYQVLNFGVMGIIIGLWP